MVSQFVLAPGDRRDSTDPQIRVCQSPLAMSTHSPLRLAVVCVVVYFSFLL